MTKVVFRNLSISISRCNMILAASSSDMNAYKLTHQLKQVIERSGKTGKRSCLSARKREEDSKT